jgi:hypothetical protein
LRLVTFPPLPPFPERKLPRFSRRMALATALLAPWLYFRRLDFFFAGMSFSCPLESLFWEEVVPSISAANLKQILFGPAIDNLSTTIRAARKTDETRYDRLTKDCFWRRPVIVLAIGL